MARYAPRKHPVFGFCRYKATETNYIYQEVLQGAKNQKEFNLLNKYLSTQTFFPLQNGHQSFQAAAAHYLLCRKNGFTIRSTIDLLIVQTAIENDLALLHNDKDFTTMALFIKEIKIWQ